MIVGKLFNQEYFIGDSWREQFLILDQDELGIDLDLYDITVVMRKSLDPQAELVWESDPSNIIIEGDEVPSQLTISINKSIGATWKPGRYWRDIRFSDRATGELFTVLRGEVRFLKSMFA